MTESVNTTELSTVSNVNWRNPIIFSGYMVKFSKLLVKKTYWSKRFFILDKSGLWYFKDERSTKNPKKNRPILVKGVRFWKSDFKAFCLKIEKYPKPFYFHVPLEKVKSTKKEERKKTDRCEIRDLWISKLVEVGAIYSGDMIVDEYLTTNLVHILSKPLKSWKQAHILDWLSFLPLEDGKSIGDVYESKFEGVVNNSKRIFELRDRMLLEKFGIENREHRMTIAQSVRYVKRKKKMEPNFHIVYKKLHQYFFSKFQILADSDPKVTRLSITSYWMIATNLSRERSLLKSYLSDDPPRSLETEIFQYVRDVSDSTLSEEKNVSGHLLTFKGISPEILRQYRYTPSARTLDRKWRRGQRKTTDRYYNEGTLDIVVRVVISDLPRLNSYLRTDPDPRKFLSPFITDFPRDEYITSLTSKTRPKYHTGLIIGGWYFEWDESSICIPRRWDEKGTMTYYLESFYDLGRLEIKHSEIREFMNKLAGMVIRYNTTKMFDKKRCNGQHFIDEMFQVLGITPTEGDTLTNYFSLLRENGGEYHVPAIPVGGLMGEMYGYNRVRKVLEFETHAELDAFFFELENTDIIALRTDYLAEYNQLYRAYDMSFWIKHYLFPEVEAYKPISEEKILGVTNDVKCGCPRNDIDTFLRGLFVPTDDQRQPIRQFLTNYENAMRVMKSNNRGSVVHPIPYQKYYWNGYDENDAIQLKTVDVRTGYYYHKRGREVVTFCNGNVSIVSLYDRNTKIFTVSSATSNSAERIKIVSLKFDNDPLSRLLRLESDDMFMIDCLTKLLFVSYSRKEVICEVPLRKGCLLSYIRCSKLFDRSILVFEKDRVRVLNYENFTTIHDFDLSESFQSEICLEIEKARLDEDIFKKRRLVLNSFLNPKDMSEEVVVLVGPNRILFVVVRRGWRGPREHVVHINCLDASCSSIFRGRYLMLGNKRGYFSIFHMDMKSSIGGGDHGRWMDCQRVYDQRLHYYDVCQIRHLKPQELTEEDKCEYEDRDLFVSISSSYSVKSVLSGLSMLKHGRKLFEMASSDYLERIRFVLVMDDDDDDGYYDEEEEEECEGEEGVQEGGSMLGTDRDRWDFGIRFTLLLKNCRISGLCKSFLV